MTNVPVVHPIRWPGSVHRKGQPKLARSVELNEGAEIDLSDVLEAFEAACTARGIAVDSAHGGGNGEQRETGELIALVISGRLHRHR